jgi:hypothetical protein
MVSRMRCAAGESVANCPGKERLRLWRMDEVLATARRVEALYTCPCPKAGINQRLASKSPSGMMIADLKR